MAAFICYVFASDGFGRYAPAETTSAPHSGTGASRGNQSKGVRISETGGQVPHGHAIAPAKVRLTLENLNIAVYDV